MEEKDYAILASYISWMLWVHMICARWKTNGSMLTAEPEHTTFPGRPVGRWRPGHGFAGIFQYSCCEAKHCSPLRHSVASHKRGANMHAAAGHLHKHHSSFTT